MNLLRRSFSLLRTWLGLGDPSDGHPTPSHGWLLPAREVVVAPARPGVTAPTVTRLP
jgi:hypothetical protein